MITFIVKSDDHSGHGLPVGAEVTFYEHDYDDDVDRYTQGGEGDEVAIDPRDLAIKVVVWTVGASLDYHDDYAVFATEAECVDQLRKWFPAADEDKTLDDDEFIEALVNDEYGFTGPDRSVLECEVA